MKISKILYIFTISTLFSFYTYAQEPIIVEYNYQEYMSLPKTLNGLYTWQEAINTCKDLNAFGYSDWEVPSYPVLQVLYKKGIYKYNAPWSSAEHGNTAYSYMDRRIDAGKMSARSCICVRKK